MGLKYHTIILVPHARARFRKWRVTNRQLATWGAIVLAVGAFSIFSTFAFFTNSVDHDELERVRVENESLRQVNRSFEDSIRSLEKQLAGFEERTRQLAIVAGLESLDGDQQSGVGGPGIPGPDGDLETLNLRAASLASDLASIDDELDERLRWISATPAIAPVRGILTSSYGYRRDPLNGQRAFHDGIDISTAPGRPVIASADGIVLRAGRASGLGNAVYLTHGYGITTRYGHLSKITVQPGASVRRGDVIGHVGNTGRTTGYHLHYEVLRDGRSVNPRAYILDSTAPGS